MDFTHLTPAPLDGEKKQRAIQDAKDMASFIARSAERANCPPPPYDFLELIGKGGSGRVYKCRKRADGELVAIKIINTDEIDYSQHAMDKDETIKDFKKEVNILHQLKDSNAKNVNMIHDAFSFQEQLWIVCDYCTGGSVRTLLRACTAGLSESFIIPIARELALAVKSVHDIGIIHRDIKCTNVYVNERGEIQLGDFGIVGITDDGVSKRRTIIGTPHYMPPELHVPTLDNKASEAYGKEVDIWSYGCSVYEMATGQPPHATVTDMNALNHHVLNDTPRLDGAKYSEELRDFIAFCLNKDPSTRPTADQILKHPYISNTQKRYPTSNLVSLIEQYKIWEFGGGQRLSLFMPGGAPDVPAAHAAFSDTEDDDDWNFSTSDDFDVAFGKRYSQMFESQLGDGSQSAVASGANLPRIQTQDLTVLERYMQDREERSANRGEMSLQRLWNPESTPYELHTPYDTFAGDDLPLRSAQSAPERESQIMIDLDEGDTDSAAPALQFDFGSEMPTLKARRSHLSMHDDADGDENYEYGKVDDEKRATMEWTFPKRKTMEWTFPRKETKDPSTQMELTPLNTDDAMSQRPALKHTTTVPIGQFGDYVHSTPQTGLTSSSPIRLSSGSMIDLDTSFADPVEIPRPSTAVSASGSTMTDMTSGDPFDLDEQQPKTEPNRFSYHKQWQSEGGQTNRNSHKTVPMHLRGSSLSSTDSEHESMIHTEAQSFDRVPRRPLYSSRNRRRHEPTNSDTTDTDSYWPGFDSSVGTNGVSATRLPEIDFPALTAPHPNNLIEDTPTQLVMSELGRLLDDFAGALGTTTNALKQYTGWDEQDEVPIVDSSDDTNGLWIGEGTHSDVPEDDTHYSSFSGA